MSGFASLSRRCGTGVALAFVKLPLNRCEYSQITRHISTVQNSQKRAFSSSEEKSNGQQSDPNNANGDQIPSSDSIIFELNDKIKKLEAEVKEMQERILRSYAEEENVRRIAKRDVENAKAYANTSFAKALLDVADNLERGLGAVSGARKENNDPTLQVLLDGVDMTSKGLTKVFNQFGIVKYGAVGDAFEPTMYDALYRIPSAESPANTVGQVLKAGYKLKDRVIRAAEVGIVVAPDNGA